MVGEPNSGIICVNGAGAHLVKPGDLVIVAAFCEMEEAEARRHQPKIVRVNEKNRII
jgi:aspartate 1-decarboxylase